MPLMVTVVADFLFCNIIQALVMEQQGGGSDGGGSDGDGAPPQPDNKVASSQTKEAIYTIYGQPLLRVMLKVVRKILDCSHSYVLSSDVGLPVRPLVACEAQHGNLDGFLAIAGKNPLQGKEAKPLFQNLFSGDVKGRIAGWNDAAVVNKEQEKLWSGSSDFMLPFLSSHFASFSGVAAFDPASSLKSALSSALQLITLVLELCPAQCAQVVGDLVSISCSGVLEFAQPGLVKLANMCGDRVFSQAFTSHQMQNCYKLATGVSVQDYSFLGVVLGDVFLWLGSLVEGPEVLWPSQDESDSAIGVCSVCDEM